MMPHLVRWQNTYGSQGLQVVYVDDGRRDSLSSAEQWPMSQNIPFHVVYDAGGAATRSYGVSAYPTAYILDRSGRVIWQGVPIYNPSQVEQTIRQALR